MVVFILQIGGLDCYAMDRHSRNLLIGRKPLLHIVTHKGQFQVFKQSFFETRLFFTLSLIFNLGTIILSILFSILVMSSYFVINQVNTYILSRVHYTCTIPCFHTRKLLQMQFQLVLLRHSRSLFSSSYIAPMTTQ